MSALKCLTRKGQELMRKTLSIMTTTRLYLQEHTHTHTQAHELREAVSISQASEAASLRVLNVECVGENVRAAVFSKHDGPLSPGTHLTVETAMTYPSHVCYMVITQSLVITRSMSSHHMTGYEVTYDTFPSFPISLSLWDPLPLYLYTSKGPCGKYSHTF